MSMTYIGSVRARIAEKRRPAASAAELAPEAHVVAVFLLCLELLLRLRCRRQLSPTYPPLRASTLEPGLNRSDRFTAEHLACARESPAAEQRRPLLLPAILLQALHHIVGGPQMLAARAALGQVRVALPGLHLENRLVHSDGRHSSPFVV